MEYKLGYEDDGYPRGVSPAHMAATLRVIVGMARAQGATTSVDPAAVLEGWGPSAHEARKTAGARLAIEAAWGHGKDVGPDRAPRSDPAAWVGAASAAETAEADAPCLQAGAAGQFVCLTLGIRAGQETGAADWEELRVAVIGDESCGKSTLVSVMTQGGLDDGCGLKRIQVFRHFHEVEAGRTSAISEQILGFDRAGRVVDSGGREVAAAGDGGAAEAAAGAGHGSSAAAGIRRQEHVAPPSWAELVGMCLGGRVVVFSDTGGHERYAKTAMLGLLGRAPDLALLVIDATKGLTRRAKERLGVVLALRLPVVVVITKSDAVPVGRVRRVASSMLRLMRSHGVERRAHFVDGTAPDARPQDGAGMPLTGACGGGGGGGGGQGRSSPGTAAEDGEGSSPRRRDSADARGDQAGLGEPLACPSAVVAPSFSTGSAESFGSARVDRPRRGINSAADARAVVAAAAATMPGSAEAAAGEASGERIAARFRENASAVVPVIAASSVTGAGLRTLRSFLRAARRQPGWAAAAKGRSTVLLNAAWDVASVKRGLVVSGVVVSGRVVVGDELVLGPDGLGRFTPARVSSIQSLRRPVAAVEAGRSASFALEAQVAQGGEAARAAAGAAAEGAAGPAATHHRRATAPDPPAAAAAAAAAALARAQEEAAAAAAMDELDGMGMGLLGADSDEDSDEDSDGDSKEECRAEGPGDDDGIGGSREESSAASAVAAPATAGAEGAARQGRPLHREAYRRGMVLASPLLHPRAMRRFEAELVVLRHPTALRPGANVAVFVRTIRQNAVVEALEPIVDEPGHGSVLGAVPEHGGGAASGQAAAGGLAIDGDLSLSSAVMPSSRSVSAPQSGSSADAVSRARSEAFRRRLRMGARTGDRCTVRLRWQHHPEYVTVGAAILIREGRIRAIGRVTAVGGAAGVKTAPSHRHTPFAQLPDATAPARRPLGLSRRASINVVDD
ncbi:hypothetical protein FNF27_05510 [Cafeteria roenbergensis]|uniref:Elongation factor Tu, chloroplastic n=1 Tax=Cafeteria roenbergensis TaxID=33653 RepID=A0A5A8E6B6_CAFRO|nr:hypothetical protein FNF27_05510 [Cafeteria roenbergensis]